MFKWFKFLKYTTTSIFTKIVDIYNYSINFLRKIVLKNKDIAISLLCLYFFFPFISQIFFYLITLRWQDITFESLKQEITNLIFNVPNSTFSENNPSILIISIIFGFLFFEFIFQIQNLLKNKKPIVSISERLFAITPYILSIIEMTHSLIDSCMLFIQAVVPKDFVEQFFRNYLSPILITYSNLPGFKQGMLGFFIFYFGYYYVGRNKDQFSFFIRYHFVQSLSFNFIYQFICHLYFLWVKRNPFSEVNDFIGFNIYSFFLFVNLIGIIFAIIGKETKITFLDEAIQYHIGPRKKSEN